MLLQVRGQFGKQDQGFVTLWLARHILKMPPILSYIGFGGNGNQIRDILHIDDVCKIIFQKFEMKKLNSIHNNTFNIGGGPSNALSLKILTSKCQKLTNNKINIRKVATTSKFDIPMFVTDNNKRLNKVYKWKPKKRYQSHIKLRIFFRI